MWNFDAFSHNLSLNELLLKHLRSFSYHLSFFFFKNIYLFLIDWWLVYNIGSISFIHQHKLNIGVYMSCPSWVSLPPPGHAYPSRLVQSSSLRSLSPTANYHWLSVCICWCICIHATLHLSHPLPLLPYPCP